MSILFLVLSLSVIPFNLDKEILTDKFDAVHLNHFHDDRGQLVFTQLLFMNQGEIEVAHNVYKNTFVVHAHLMFNNGHPSIKEGGIHFNKRNILFIAGDRFRKIYYTSFSETWTQNDLDIQQMITRTLNLRKGLYNGKISPEEGEQ